MGTMEMEDLDIRDEFVNGHVKIHLEDTILQYNKSYYLRVAMDVKIILPTCSKFLLVRLMRPNSSLSLATNDGLTKTAPAPLGNAHGPAWDTTRCFSARRMVPFELRSDGSAPLAKATVFGRLPMNFPDYDQKGI